MASRVGLWRQSLLAVVRNPWRLALTAAAAAAVAGGLLTFVVAPLQDRFPGNLFDFHAYLAGARAAAHHASVYAAFERAQQNPQFAGFDYPPLIAWLLQPLTWMPERAAAVLWVWAMLACTVIAAIVLGRALLPETWPRLEIAALAAFVFTPATFNLGLGQLEPLVLLLLTLALVAYLRGDRLTCGVLIGIAASLKLAPIVLVLVLVKRRWWRASFAAVATVLASALAGAMALGLPALTEYATRVLPLLARQDGWLYNQSIGGVINRAADHSVLGFQPALLWISITTVCMAVAAVGATVVVTRAGARPRSERAMEFACGVLALLIAGSITWYLHLLLLLIPFFAAAAYLARRGIARERSLAVAGCLCVLGVGVAGAVLSDAVFVNFLIAHHGSRWWWPLLQLASLPAASVVAFFVVAVRTLTSARAPSPSGYMPRAMTIRASLAGDSH